jgi:hypothetical protein
MKNNRVWVFILAALLVIAFATSWGFIIKCAVIINAIIILFNICLDIYKIIKKRELN